MTRNISRILVWWLKKFIGICPWLLSVKSHGFFTKLLNRFPKNKQYLSIWLFDHKLASMKSIRVCNITTSHFPFSEMPKNIYSVNMISISFFSTQSSDKKKHIQHSIYFIIFFFTTNESNENILKKEKHAAIWKRKMHASNKINSIFVEKCVNLTFIHILFVLQAFFWIARN